MAAATCWTISFPWGPQPIAPKDLHVWPAIIIVNTNIHATHNTLYWLSGRQLVLSFLNGLKKVAKIMQHYFSFSLIVRTLAFSNHHMPWVLLTILSICSPGTLCLPCRYGCSRCQFVSLLVRDLHAACCGNPCRFLLRWRPLSATYTNTRVPKMYAGHHTKIRHHSHLTRYLLWAQPRAAVDIILWNSVWKVCHAVMLPPDIGWWLSICSSPNYSPSPAASVPGARGSMSRLPLSVPQLHRPCISAPDGALDYSFILCVVAVTVAPSPIVGCGNYKQLYTWDAFQGISLWQFVVSWLRQFLSNMSQNKAGSIEALFSVQQMCRKIWSSLRLASLLYRTIQHEIFYAFSCIPFLDFNARFFGQRRGCTCFSSTPHSRPLCAYCDEYTCYQIYVDSSICSRASFICPVDSIRSRFSFHCKLPRFDTSHGL